MVPVFAPDLQGVLVGGPRKRRKVSRDNPLFARSVFGSPSRRRRRILQQHQRRPAPAVRLVFEEEEGMAEGVVDQLALDLEAVIDGGAPAAAPAAEPPPARPCTPAIVSHDLCLARVWAGGAGGQCQIRRPDQGVLCRRHMQDQKHGLVTGDVPPDKLAEFRRRSGQ